MVNVVRIDSRNQPVTSVGILNNTLLVDSFNFRLLFMFFFMTTLITSIPEAWMNCAPDTLIKKGWLFVRGGSCRHGAEISAEGRSKGDKQSKVGRLSRSDFKMAETDRESFGVCENKEKKTHLGWFMHLQKKI